MEMRHLRYFVAVAEEGGFQKAAKRLHVAQPALSKQIKQLEAEIGTPLFHRKPTVRVTNAGERFLREAVKALDHVSRAVDAARETIRHDHDKVVVAHARLSSYPTIFTRLLTSFQQKHPDARVIVEQMEQVRMRTALRDHRADVGFGMVPTLELADLCVMPLVDCTVRGVLLHESDPNAQHPRVSLKQLNDLTWFHLPSSGYPILFRAMRAALAERGLSPAKHKPRPADLAASAMRLATTRGFVLASQDMQRFERAGFGVVYRPFEEEPIPCWIAMLWRTAETNPLLNDLVRIAAEMKEGSAQRVRK